MKITKVEIQKKNKERASIYIDGEFSCGLSLETVLKYHLKENKDISESELNHFKSNSEKESALNKALRHLAKSSKTQKEVFDFLLKKGFETEIIYQVIEKLKEYSFLSDELYAQNFVKYKSKNSGRKKIEYELKQKGINDNIISQKIFEFSDDKKQVFVVAEKYLKNKLLTDIKNKQKAFRHLMSRGFSSEIALSCLNQIFKEANADDCGD